MMPILVIIFSYLSIGYMISEGFPFVVLHNTTNLFGNFFGVTWDDFSYDVAWICTLLYISRWYKSNKLLIITRLLLIVSCTPLSFFVSVFLLNIASKFIIIYPVIPKRLSGLATLTSYFLIILTVVIIPNIYLQNIILKKYWLYDATDSQQQSTQPLIIGNNKKMFLVIGFLTDIIFPLFLLYNIVYRNQHLPALFLSTIITRIAYIYLTGKYNSQISSTTSITIRIVSFLVCCVSLAVMIFVGTGTYRDY